jgi:Protein of unknown function (DUF2815)
MTQLSKDSTLDPRWLQEQLRVNPPRLLDNGNIFSGPVRLAFPNLFKPRVAQGGQGEGKFGAALLFPFGADMMLFSQIWTKAAKEAFPKHWDASGQPVGLHIPFHDQKEKAFGVKPLAGYTPGAITFTVSSNFKPQVVDVNMNPIVDEARVYPGVWAFVVMNVYKYGPPQPKTGIAFGLQNVMIIADDQKLGGGGSDPRKDFAHITMTAQSDIAKKFDNAPVQNAGGQGVNIMPTGGFVGQAGTLPVQPLHDDASEFM